MNDGTTKKTEDEEEVARLMDIIKRAKHELWDGEGAAAAYDILKEAGDGTNEV